VPLLNLPGGRHADQVETTRIGTLEKEKRENAASQWTLRGLIAAEIRERKRKKKNEN